MEYYLVGNNRSLIQKANPAIVLSNKAESSRDVIMGENDRGTRKDAFSEKNMVHKRLVRGDLIFCGN